MYLVFNILGVHFDIFAGRISSQKMQSSKQDKTCTDKILYLNSKAKLGNFHLLQKRDINWIQCIQSSHV